MGSASSLLRFRVYRVGDTHTPAQTHAGIVRETMCLCVHVCRIRLSLDSHLPTQILSLRVKFLENIQTRSMLCHHRHMHANTHANTHKEVPVWVMQRPQMSVALDYHLARGQFQNNSPTNSSSNYPDYAGKKSQPKAHAGGWGMNLPRTGPSVLLLPRPPACVLLLCCT